MWFKSKYFLLAASIFLFLSCDNDGPENEEPESLSEYISQVFEYAYAPGQHAQYVKKTDGDNFIGKPTVDVYLGGFGGYIVAGFDHDVTNESGYDFEVFSNGVAPEPAIVYVMCDENNDGLPNETWYELKGSEFENKGTMPEYTVTYYKAQNAEANITWKDNYSGAGELISTYNGAWTYNWWWDDAVDNVTFTGTRLPDAYVPQTTGETTIWSVPDNMFLWGYAENNEGEDYSSDSKSNKFDIANAVDGNGASVNLPHIRFIKVQTAVFQQAGWLNEVSAEVKGARDLHYNP